MSILIIGGNGNMGRRYQAVLRHLHKPFRIAEIGTKPKEVAAMAERADGIIIATPTDTHTAFLLSLAKLGKPLLCEKPLSKDPKELQGVLRFIKKLCPIAMAYQYGMLADTKAKGLTSYDYFKHGTDGIFWDCIQLIGLSNGDIHLSETSPVWQCQINGKRIQLGQIDHAYIDFISMWMKKPSQDVEGLIDLHATTAELEQDSLRQDERNH